MTIYMLYNYNYKYKQQLILKILQAMLTLLGKHPLSLTVPSWSRWGRGTFRTSVETWQLPRTAHQFCRIWDLQWKQLLFNFKSETLQTSTETLNTNICSVSLLLLRHQKRPNLHLFYIDGIRSTDLPLPTCTCSACWVLTFLSRFCFLLLLTTLIVTLAVAGWSPWLNNWLWSMSIVNKYCNPILSADIDMILKMLNAAAK